MSAPWASRGQSVKSREKALFSTETSPAAGLIVLMPEIKARLMTRLPLRWLPACIVLLGALAQGSAASAQMNPQLPPQPIPQRVPQQPPVAQGAQPYPEGVPPSSNPICTRLEAQLAILNRGSGTDPAKAAQISRYQAAANQQQQQLDRVTSQSSRMGCDRSAFLSFFTGRSAQCGPINRRIEQMRANLNQIETSLAQLRGGDGMGNNGDDQRRSVIAALGQNRCGPQYVNTAPAQGPGGFLANLFGNSDNNASPPPPGSYPTPASGTYRTICVRTCDGGFFPISFATVPARFAEDENTCKALCPAAKNASLFVYPNPGGKLSQAVSLTGQPYTSLPNAFRFRTKYDPTCACKAPGQSWAEALKGVEGPQGGNLTPQQVTPAPAKERAAAVAGTQPPAATAAATSATSDATPAHIRIVGPPFIPQH